MAVDERDPHTGYMTTGHEWNGIKELNTPVPRPVYFFLIVTALFSVVYCVLMPAWPLGVTYTKGLGAHAVRDITYALGGGYTSFLADIGIDDETGNGTVVFQVFADGVKIYDSGTMNQSSSAPSSRHNRSAPPVPRRRSPSST